MINFKHNYYFITMFQKIKNYLINQSTNHSLETFVISLLLTLFVFWGFKNFKVDDDLVKTFPQNMPSKIIWDDIQEEFGQTEFIFVAFGKNYTPPIIGNVESNSPSEIAGFLKYELPGEILRGVFLCLS